MLWKAEAGGSLSLCPAWFTQQVSGQPGLHSQTLSQKPKQKVKLKLIYIYVCACFAFILVCLHSMFTVSSHARRWDWSFRQFPVLGIEPRSFNALSHLSSPTCIFKYQSVAKLLLPSPTVEWHRLLPPIRALTPICRRGAGKSWGTLLGGRNCRWTDIFCPLQGGASVVTLHVRVHVKMGF